MDIDYPPVLAAPSGRRAPRNHDIDRCKRRGYALVRGSSFTTTIKATNPQRIASPWTRRSTARPSLSSYALTTGPANIQKRRQADLPPL